MQRITAVDYESSEGKTKELLDGVKAKIGSVPNMMKTLAASPEVLEAYLNFSGTLGSTLDAKLREQISLTTAEINGCGYCASAHSAIGKMVGLNEQAIKEARLAGATDDKVDAALKFTKALVLSRGEVSDADFQNIKSAGYSEKEISEIIANVVLNIFTNYINKTALTVNDFPKVEFPLASEAIAA